MKKIERIDHEVTESDRLWIVAALLAFVLMMMFSGLVVFACLLLF